MMMSFPWTAKGDEFETTRRAEDQVMVRQACHGLDDAIDVMVQADSISRGFETNDASTSMWVERNNRGLCYTTGRPITVTLKEWMAGPFRGVKNLQEASLWRAENNWGDRLYTWIMDKGGRHQPTLSEQL